MTHDPKQTLLQQSLGARCRSIRQSNGWSQEELALRAGLHRTYIGSVERGERNVSLVNLQRLADAFGMTLHEFLRFVSAPEELP